MHVATFRIKGRGAFADITQEVDASIELWCNDHCDLLRVSDRSDQSLLSKIDDLAGVRESITESNEEMIITENCLEQYEVTMVDTYLARHGCLMLPPLTYHRGYKTCRILALESENLTSLYRDLADQTNVVVESKRKMNGIAHDAPMLTLGDTLPTFSARQREVLLLAYEQGYYEIPRSTTTTKIANEMGIERRTAEQHLRRAENKLVESIVSIISPHT